MDNRRETVIQPKIFVIGNWHENNFRQTGSGGAIFL